MRPRSLLADVDCEQWAEPVPPMAHRLMADVDATLGQQVRNAAQAQRMRTYIITKRRITSGEELT